MYDKQTGKVAMPYEVKMEKSKDWIKMSEEGNKESQMLEYLLLPFFGDELAEFCNACRDMQEDYAKSKKVEHKSEIPSKKDVAKMLGIKKKKLSKKLYKEFKSGWYDANPNLIKTEIQQNETEIESGRHIAKVYALASRHNLRVHWCGIDEGNIRKWKLYQNDFPVVEFMIE